MLLGLANMRCCQNSTASAKRVFEFWVTHLADLTIFSATKATQPQTILTIVSGGAFLPQHHGITPMDFFNFDSSRPKEVDTLCNNLNKLSDSQFRNIQEIVGYLANFIYFINISYTCVL